MKVSVDKSFASIELSDGTKLEIEEKPYGSSLREGIKTLNNFVFIKIKGVEIFKMFLNEVEDMK